MHKLFVSICLLFTLYVNNAQAQLTDFMWHRGFMFGLTTLPAFNYSPDSTTFRNYPFTDSASVKDRGAYQFGLNWGARMNVHNIDAEHSISLHVDVVASLYLQRDFLSSDFTELSSGSGLQIPIVVNYNIGHMATKDAVSDHGYVVGLGVEINSMSYLPVAGARGGFNYFGFDPAKLEMNSGMWIQPVLNLGYRYWKEDFKAREFNVQFGWGYYDRLSNGTSLRPNIRLSLHKYINY